MNKKPLYHAQEILAELRYENHDLTPTPRYPDAYSYESEYPQRSENHYPVNDFHIGPFQQFEYIHYELVFPAETYERRPEQNRATIRGSM